MSGLKCIVIISSISYTGNRVQNKRIQNSLYLVNKVKYLYKPFSLSLGTEPTNKIFPTHSEILYIISSAVFLIIYDFDIGLRSASMYSNYESVYRFCFIFALLCITGTGRCKGSFDSEFVEEEKGEW